MTSYPQKKSFIELKHSVCVCLIDHTQAHNNDNNANTRNKSKS